MEEVLTPTVDESRAHSGERLKDFIFAAAAVCAALVVFGCVFNRATVLSYSIGYNLYGSERLLEGEIPYKDFHTLYPPAILYVNAALFKWLGVSLYSAMIGVLVFKVLTILMLYLSGRLMMPRSWALLAVLLSLFWLRPNGAFKSVPMQYGALFLAIGLYLLLRYESRPKIIYVFLAGAAIGAVTMFKHNIGACALLGYLAFLSLEGMRIRLNREGEGGGYRRALAIAGGFAAVVLPILFYMQSRGALASMTRTLLFGPGEFLSSRLVIPLSPVVPGVFVLLLAATACIAYKLRARRAFVSVIWSLLIIATSVFLLRADESAINQLIFYTPIIVFAVALIAFAFNKRVAVEKRRVVFLTLVFAAAAFVELFPRFAREQSIGAIPFVILLSMYLLYESRPAIERLTGGALQARLALAVLPLTFLLTSGRLFVTTYFDAGFRFKSNTELKTERGRGVRLPERIANNTDEVVNYIQQRVPPGGYVFAQSSAGSAYLFLAGRKNPSSAQFWGGVGVTPSERVATLEEIDRRQVKLIVTSEEAFAAEEYEPLREYINQNFKPVTRFDDVLVLER